MPIYEYKCEQCGRETEVIQKISDRPKRKCEQCSGRLRKLVSRASFQLKGGGWYDQGYHKGSSSSGKPESKPESKSDSKSKPETKSKSKDKKAASA